MDPEEQLSGVKLLCGRMQRVQAPTVLRPAARVDAGLPGRRSHDAMMSPLQFFLRHLDVTWGQYHHFTVTIQASEQ